MSIGQPMHNVPHFIKDIIYNEKDKWNAYPTNYQAYLLYKILI